MTWSYHKYGPVRRPRSRGKTGKQKREAARTRARGVLLSTNDLAELMDTTPRRVRERADEFGGRKDEHGHWVFPKTKVDFLLARGAGT